MTKLVCLFLEAAFKVGDGALDLAAPFVLLRTLESVNKGQGLMNHLQYYQEEIGKYFCVGGHTCDEAGSRMTEETP